MTAPHELAPSAERDQAWSTVRVLRVAVAIAAAIVVIVASPPMVWGIVLAACTWPTERAP